MLPPAGQNFEKGHFLENFVNFGKNFFMPFKQRVSRGCCLRRVTFLKKCISCIILSILANLLCLSSRSLAGMLPPAGQTFEKWHFLGFLSIWPKLFAPFKQGSSRGAASGGSDFWKMALP